MIVVGIDPSLTCTAIVTGGLGKPRAEEWKPQKLRGPIRLLALRESLACYLDTTRPGLAVVEGYSFGSRNGRESLGEWGGIIRVELWARGIPYLVVPPTTLKLYAAGKGNAPDLITAVRKRWRYRTTSSDVADAFALMKLGQDWASPDGHLLVVAAKCELYATEMQRRQFPASAVTKMGPLISKR